MMRAKAAACAVVLTGLLGACSFSASTGTPSLSKAELESRISAQLAKTVGQSPSSVVCPGPLDATVGKTERCTLVSAAGNTFGLTVTVTSVSGATLNFTIAVDQTPSATATT